ncbi:MAG: phosphoribosylglycinamide formyltransferase [Endomicrobium sp.]|jgi:phosphoribosylglycinamide formyltransferase-1|nr:phosphoribosylglycinamide formyltransferase [Endomicrobium sp.]
MIKHIAILVSGNGSNMRAIINATKRGILKKIAKVILVISSNPTAYAIKYAECENISTICVRNSELKNENFLNCMILRELQNIKVDIICLAGYTRIISRNLIDTYHNRILNIHPSLLPKFGGKGMYGIRVHKAVIESRETKSGATVHFVDEGYDTGSIIMQQEVKVLKTDTPNDLANRVLNVEHEIYPKAIKKIIENLK